ncbi:SseB family protein [Nocardia thraciensis]
MIDTEDGLAVLRAEIAAFYAGFGQPDALVAAFRDAALLVPLTDDDRISTCEVGGVWWIAAFTSEEEFARYLARRGAASGGELRYHTLCGWRLGEYAAECEDPTGVMIDAVGPAPMAFPPMIDEDSAARVGVL